jgi:hexosaminidase
MKLLFILAMMVTSITTVISSVAMGEAQLPASIIPMPTKLAVAGGKFVLTASTQIRVDAPYTPLGMQLAGMLAPATGFALRIGIDQSDNSIRIDIDPSAAGIGDEGYRLVIQPKQIFITAKKETGAFYAFQTLRQLLPPRIFSSTAVDGVAWEMPCVNIEDRPRFRWRGLMLDCSRHFMPKEYIERFLDVMAIHKFNTFHWHLVDDQGWRLEIRKYPRLTEIGAWRNQTLVGHAHEKPEKYDGKRYGGFYTQDDVREIVAYAADRHITIVPEIEMPGHSRAAIAAYPQLGNTSEPIGVKTNWGVEPHILNADESTILFYHDVLGEVLELFPSKFIHVGADEAVKDEWNASPKIKARMTELGVKNAHDLQSYFIHRMDDYLTAHGRRLVGWDEILEGGLSPNAVVMSWHGDAPAIEAARQGHDAVMSPHQLTYFDYYQSQDKSHEPLAIGGFLPLSKVYEFDPMPTGLPENEGTHILGGQGQIWTEYIQTPQQVDYMAYPRACALAEDLWTPASGKNYEQFIQRLDLHLQRLQAMQVHFRMPENIKENP